MDNFGTAIADRIEQLYDDLEIIEEYASTMPKERSQKALNKLKQILKKTIAELEYEQFGE